MEQTDAPAPPGIKVSIIAVMLFQVFSLFVAAYARRKMIESGIGETDATHLGRLLGLALLSICMWPIVRQNWPVLRTLFARPASSIRLVPASIALGIFLWLTNALVLIGIGVYQSFAIADLSNDASLVYSFSCESYRSLLLAIFAMSVVVPIIEEIINRGLFLQALLPKGKWFAILISALLFMVLHEPSINPAAFIFGVVAAIQFLHWRNLWAVILAHSTVNLLVSLQTFCGAKQFSPGAVTWEFGGAAQLFVLALSLCIAGIWWLAAKCQTDAGS